MTKKSEIKLIVDLDSNRVPEKIFWQAEDSEAKQPSECLSMMLSVWAKQEKVTMGIDLWTKEMTIDDMNIHVHQTLVKLTDTYLRATKNSEAAKLIENCSAAFAEKLNLLKNG
jgi:gliding motility-associated protein GldC